MTRSAKRTKSEKARVKKKKTRFLKPCKLAQLKRGEAAKPKKRKLGSRTLRK